MGFPLKFKYSSYKNNLEKDMAPYSVVKPGYNLWEKIIKNKI
jgi:hypothetical protein